MNAEGYENILREALLPFLQNAYPRGHRLMQDNDPKHTSNRVVQFLNDEGVNWWKTPPESPDLNPIENLWHELRVPVQGSKTKWKTAADRWNSRVLGDY